MFAIRAFAAPGVLSTRAPPLASSKIFLSM
ncbi:hypothetical protein A2U01_0112772, partial [Trifolium medium]|nr:hypothetical protein [Trifolium medium]